MDSDECFSATVGLPLSTSMMSFFTLLPDRVAHLHCAAGILHDGSVHDGDERGYHEGRAQCRGHIRRVQGTNAHLS